MSPHSNSKSMPMRCPTVRSSSVHGRGVFALTRASAGERLFEYRGRLFSWETAQCRYEQSTAEAGHTFLFDLGDGRVIEATRIRAQCDHPMLLYGRRRRFAESADANDGSSKRRLQRWGATVPRSHRRFFEGRRTRRVERVHGFLLVRDRR
jgi:hypothetical protein